jgi:uncharacterized paraquat-inducible protein A
MPDDDQCPVCHTLIPADTDTGEQRAECPGCGADLVRPEGRGWNVAGDAPAG